MGIDFENVKLKLLSPTDCIRDRLASYMFFKERKCLEQAVLVASSQSFSRKKVKDWCHKEGYSEVFDEFISLLK